MSLAAEHKRFRWRRVKGKQRERRQGVSRWSSLLAITTLFGLNESAIAQQMPSVQQLSQASQVQELSQTNLLYVSASRGDDRVGNGSDRAPLRTITYALSVASPNTAILLAPGTYSTQTGESFPIKLKPNVALQGNPDTRGQNIVIQGGGQFISPTSAGQDITILAADGAQINGVTVTNPNYRGYGIWIESSSPTVANNTLTGNTHDGISVVGTSAPVIRGNYFSKNGANGITIFGTSRPEVKENVFENTGFGINVAQQATPMVIGNRIAFNKDGVVVQASARPVLRNNYIERNQRDGVVAIASALPDLGTAAEPGGNVIRNNGRYDIHNAVSSQIIPAYGNQILGKRTSGRVDIAGVYRPTGPSAPVTNRLPPIARIGGGPSLDPRPPVTQPVPDSSITISVPPPQIQPAPPPRRDPLPLPPPRRRETQINIPTEAVDIPVPSPEGGSEVQLPLPSAPPPNFESNRPLSSEGLLPVPGPNIPIGRGGYIPNGITADNGADLNLAGGLTLGLRYRVVVDTQSESEQVRVRSLVPGAFRTYVNGRSVMQAGAFRDRSKADTLLQMLSTNGLSARIEEMQ